jgi:hypothetical protein
MGTGGVHSLDESGRVVKLTIITSDAEVKYSAASFYERMCVPEDHA